MRSVLRAALAVVAFSSLTFANPAVAAQATRLFASEEVLQLTIKGPVGRMSRAADAMPVPGVLTVKGAAPETLPIALSVRGLTRAKRETCAFPPISVAFPERPPAGSLFRGQGADIKLVTHCRPAENFQQFVLLEYAAYLIYNAVTPNSFRARLATIDYVDENDRPVTTRFGFFIEDIDDAANRNGQERLRGKNFVSIPQLDAMAAARVALFEYMIGNLDWSVIAAPPPEDCCHNSRLVGAKDATTGLIPVPYDFDFSGLVNAPYAVPPDSVRVRSVRDRYFRGYCQHNEQVPAAAAELLARRAAVLAAFDRVPQLDQASRQRAVNYLGTFFDQIGTPAQITTIVRTCR